MAHHHQGQQQMSLSPKVQLPAQTGPDRKLVAHTRQHLAAHTRELVELLAVPVHTCQWELTGPSLRKGTQTVLALMLGHTAQGTL